MRQKKIYRAPYTTKPGRPPPLGRSAQPRAPTHRPPLSAQGNVRQRQRPDPPPPCSTACRCQRREQQGGGEVRCGGQRLSGRQPTRRGTPRNRIGRTSTTNRHLSVKAKQNESNPNLIILTRKGAKTKKTKTTTIQKRRGSELPHEAKVGALQPERGNDAACR